MKNKKCWIFGTYRLFSLWLVAFYTLLVSCVDNNILDLYGQNTFLQVQVAAGTARGAVLGDVLPDGSEISLTLLAADNGIYDRQDYTNIPYKAYRDGGVQKWLAADRTVTLSSTEGRAVAYWPWTDGTDYTAVPVETDSQTDYMYSGWVSGLSNTNPVAVFHMQHALALVRVSVVSRNYSGQGRLAAVTAASEAFCTSGTMNATTGALSDLAGAGTPFVYKPFDAVLGGTAQTAEFLVLPSGQAADVALGISVDGQRYSSLAPADKRFRQGCIYTYNLTLEGTDLMLDGVTVTPWVKEHTVNTDMLLPDNQYVVQVSVGAGNYTYKHNLQNFSGFIEWGDGTTTVYDTPTSWPAHTYAAAGEYTVAAVGQAVGLNSSSATKDISKIFHIGKDMGIALMSGAFQNQSKLKEIPVDLFDGVTDVTGFSSTFSGCSSLTAIPEGLFDKCTQAITFNGTFNGCAALTSIPAGLFDKCTEVTSFQNTFTGCSSLTAIPEGLFDKCTQNFTFNKTFTGCTGITSIPEGLFDNCTAVTNFAQTFANCAALTSIPAGLFDNNPKVTTFNQTFSGCASLAGVPVGLFGYNTKVTNFGQTFAGCANLKALPAGLFDNNPEVTDFYATFQLTGLTSIPTGLFDNNTKVTTFNSTFDRCYLLAEIPQGLFDNNVKVTNFSSTFWYCESLQSIPESLFKYCPLVTNFSYTFCRCTGLLDIPVGLFDYNTKVTNFKNTFVNCWHYTGESPYTIINVNGTDVKVHLYERSSYPEYFTAPTSYTGCFTDCYVSDIDAIEKAGWH